MPLFFFFLRHRGQKPKKYRLLPVFFESIFFKLLKNTLKINLPSCEDRKKVTIFPPPSAVLAQLQASLSHTPIPQSILCSQSWGGP